MFVWEAGLVSRGLSPEKDAARTMTVTSGQKCIELYVSSAPTQSWGKMFAALLIGTTEWYSTRCSLIWKPKVTKSNRLYFLLQASTLHTKEKGSGSSQIESLIPTPDCNNHRDGTKLRKDNNMMEGGRHGVSLHHMAAHGLLATPTNSMVTAQDFVQAHYHSSQRPEYKLALSLLPTPQARDHKNGSKPEDGRIARKVEQGWSMNLNDLAAGAMLPTPTATSDAKGGCARKNSKRQNDTLAHAIHAQCPNPNGKTTQLSHRFVMEMMGFPPNWIEAAFTGEDTEPVHHFDNFPQEFPTVEPWHRDEMESRLAGVKTPDTGKPLTYSRLNKEGLKGGGNAVVPPVVLAIFQALEKSWETT